eukprot:3140865-Pleurochrysis_carterae.AAC.2
MPPQPLAEAHPGSVLTGFGTATSWHGGGGLFEAGRDSPLGSAVLHASGGLNGRFTRCDYSGERCFVRRRSFARIGVGFPNNVLFLAHGIRCRDYSMISQPVCWCRVKQHLETKSRNARRRQH